MSCHKLYKAILVVAFLFVFVGVFAPSAKAMTIAEFKKEIEGLPLSIRAEKRLEPTATELIELQNEINKLDSSFYLKLDSELKGIKQGIKEKGQTWIASYNQIFIKDDNYKKNLCGLKETLSKNTLSSTSTPVSTSTLPAFFDWRDQHGENYITPVKNQKGCGSCWAFGAAAVLEGNINAYYNNPNLNPDLSEQDLVSCFHGTGCSGAYSSQIENIFSDYYKSKGIPIESCFLYTATNNSCNNKCSNWQNVSWKTESYIAPLLTVESIKRTIMENGPIEVGMVVYNDFFSYSGGIYQHTTDSIAGYHAVTIVGFGIYDGSNYWIVKNSWGAGWGEDGYFRIFAGDSEIDSWFAFTSVKPTYYTSIERLCTDNDEDGYCNWGIGEKPITCQCISIIKDCDDSNPVIYQGCGISVDKLGILSIVSNPQDAEVFVLDETNGSYIFRGYTPLEMNLNIGDRKIKITKKDYDDYLTTVSIKEGQKTNLIIDLPQIPKIISPFNNDIFRAGDTIAIKGTVPIRSDLQFENYLIEYSIEGSTQWYSNGISLINNGLIPIKDGLLANWDTSSIKIANFYTLRLTTNYKNGMKKYAFIEDIYLDPSLKKGWPQKIDWYFSEGESENYLNIFTTADFYTNIPTSYESQESGLITPLRKEDFLKSQVLSTTEEGYYYWAGSLEPAISDIDKDGFGEIIIYKGGNPPKIFVFRQDGSLYWSVNVGTGEAAGGNLQYPLLDDINNDGFNEIIVYNTGVGVGVENWSGILYVFNYNGSILWSSQILTGNETDGHSTLTSADLNLDGNKEIIIKGNDALQEKMVVVDNQGKVISKWNLPNSMWGASIVSTPAIGNFDSDPELEIVSAGPSEKAGYDWIKNEYINEGSVYIYNLDGSVVTGWPVKLPGVIFSSPVIGDINNDGQLEIIIGLLYASDTFPDSRYGGLWALNKNGQVLPGWPFKKGYNFWSSPSLADFDKDGDLEIVASRLGFETYVLHHNGSLASGWPQNTIWNDYYSTIIGDINSDNIPDILTTAGNGVFPRNGGVYAWNFNGTKIAGFPKFTEVDAQAPATISDIDKDGLLELIASSDWDYDCYNNKDKFRGTIYVWELTGKYNPKKMPWPMFHNNPQHTGLYPKLSVLTLNATNIQTNQATLNGKIDNLGNDSSCEIWFEWGTTTSYGNTTPKLVKNAIGTFNRTLYVFNGLSANKTYHFRAVTKNSVEIIYGPDKVFTTKAPVTVLLPNDGEKWVRGKTYTIKWESFGYNFDSIVTISLIGGNITSKWYGGEMIIGRPKNTGSYNWTISSYLEFNSNYKIKVNIGGEYDLSDNYFSIVAITPTCTDSDNGKDYFIKGTTKKVSGAFTSTYYDQCLFNTNKVHEWYCDSADNPKTIDFECLYGCSDGACKQGTTSMIDIENQLASIQERILQLAEKLKQLLGR